MAAERAFFDTNVLVYLLKEDRHKGECCADLIAGGGTISVQVLNELLNVIRRKTDLNWSETVRFLETLEGLFETTDVTRETHRLGRRLAERYHLSVYDAFIVAAAILSGASVLYTEDMQDGATIEGVRIVNPFTGKA
ncbi:PIN domain-containing protein [Asticcacaulis sp.]|uniref:PIN domain-containing protein n=1 Tax=Asticcacaulis sp. TaxID=1872648 RepID=UPI0026344ACD|nr:PIN domain-containing protein [Asticcacaulis sp.]